VLFHDDFSSFPPGLLSQPVGQLNPAIQEYHYLAHRGVPLGAWANAICHLDCWAAGDEDGRPYLEQHFNSASDHMLQPELMSPLFITGEPEWRDATVEASVRPLSTQDMAGLVFRYHTNRHHYVFVLEQGKRARLAIRLPLEETFRVAAWHELAAADFTYDTAAYHRLKVENQGKSIRCYVDGRLLLSAESDEIAEGKVGVCATSPARFQEFTVATSAASKRAVERAIAGRERALAQLRAENPAPKAWKRFATAQFGAGRNVRFGDLDGDGRPEMLVAQNVAKVDNGNFVEISCLTAITLDGNVLWQNGRPNPRNGLLTSDCPFQIHDLDADGQNEVVLIKDFKLQVLAGQTGKPLRFVATPEAASPGPEYEIKNRPHERSLGDSIAFFNLSGDPGRREMLIKDRYRNFWLFDRNLQTLWSGQGTLGHYPYAFADGDRDKVAIGYSLWSAVGKQLWSLDDQLSDHADAVAVGNFSGDPAQPPLAYYSGSDEGFILVDVQGIVRQHHRLGHTQTACIGKFVPELRGLQYAVINFWKNPGIVTLLDHRGSILRQAEPIHSGSPLLPVNWRGDGQEFILLGGNIREGGMLDGQLRRAVMFPDDGHPDLCAAVLDLTGDARDEIVLWDQEQVWIYTQDRPAANARVYAPERNPDYNDSNYRTNVSLPGWSTDRQQPALPAKLDQ
jgi:rhamnogalacturonan endolyase